MKRSVALFLCCLFLLVSCQTSRYFILPGNVAKNITMLQPGLNKVGFIKKDDIVLFKINGLLVEAKVVGFYNTNYALLKNSHGFSSCVSVSKIKYSKSERQNNLQIGQKVTYSHYGIFTTFKDEGEIIAMSPLEALIKTGNTEMAIAYEHIEK